jgi:hypothetical protein
MTSLDGVQWCCGFMFCHTFAPVELTERIFELTEQLAKKDAALSAQASIHERRIAAAKNAKLERDRRQGQLSISAAAAAAAASGVLDE